MNGGCLVVIPREVTLSPAEFAGALRRERVTAIFLTTALFNQLVAAEPAAFATLRYVLTGGEACEPESFARVLERALGALDRALQGQPPKRLPRGLTLFDMVSPPP